jgi:two-component system response regulator LytT
MKIVIIEDEKLVAKDLARTIMGLDPSAEIVATIPSVEDGILFFSQSQDIDLIFSDIQLGDGLSFEIFEKTNNQVPVIFCTAFNQYALDAFKTLGIDYILKPVSKTNVGKALIKFQAIKQSLMVDKNPYTALFQQLKKQLQPSKIPGVLIHQGEKITPLDGEKIAFFYIENTTVFAQTFDNKRWMISKKLDALEEQFAPFFFRANRQFLLNRKAVKEASQYFNRKLSVTLHVPTKEQIIVGKEKVTSFFDWLAYT